MTSPRSISGAFIVPIVCPADGLALVIGALETSLTIPEVSIAGEEGVFGHPDGLALVIGALETSLTLPGVSIGDVGMLRELRRCRSTKHDNIELMKIMGTTSATMRTLGCGT